MVRARIDLENDRLAAARQKAIEAQQLDVTYSPFEERPSQLLSEIDRIETGRRLVESQARQSQQQPRQSALPTRPFEPPSVFNPVGYNPQAMLDSDLKRKSNQLIQQARIALQERRLGDAQRLASEAQKLNVSYQDLEDRPELILAEITNMLEDNSSIAGRTPAGRNLQPVSVNPFDTSSSNFGTVTAAGSYSGNVIAEHPLGNSALNDFNTGLRHLQERNEDAAYAAFLKAYQSGQKLDPYRHQQLQDFLKALAPSSGSNIRQVNNNRFSTRQEPSRINVAEQQRAVKFDRLRTQALNAIFRSERMREKNPVAAVGIIDRALAEVENSDLGPETVAPIVKQLMRSRNSIESWAKQRESLIVQEESNQRIKDLIREDREYQIRIDKDFFQVVDEFNTLYKQRRFAEAEVKAKQAKELDPENPVAVVMFYKSRIARRNQSNEDLKIRKDELLWGQLDDVEQSLVGFDFSRGPMQYGKDWDEINNRRKGKYGPDNRRRTEREKEIENSLTRQISLHFERARLIDVIKHIAAVTNINVMLDTLGLEDEGIDSNTLVTIDVDRIMLKSALNLLLKPMNLDYMVENEVLNVTSRLRQQGTLRTITYPVADLVVPIPNFVNSGTPIGMGPGGFGNYNVPGMGGVQNSSGAQFQVNDPIGLPGTPGSNFFPTPGLNARANGGVSAVDFDALSSLITTTVEPDSWAEFGG
ncbi:MAG: hypothetical protein IH899_19030, partial [Planctomycetes bacterium]|nr:hypothetical protein [Planctomycetota bacterium]